MKKAVSLMLIGFLVISILFIFAKASYANEVQCRDEYEKCRSQTLNSGAGIIKTTIMLVRCRIDLIVCVVVHLL